MDAADPTVLVNGSQAPEALVVELRGELDLASRDQVEEALLGALTAAREVVVDLGNVTFCDSTGLAMFLDVHAAAEADGKQLVLRNLLPNVWRVFDVSGVHRRVNIVGSTHD